MRLKRFVGSICVLGMLCPLAGCKKDEGFQTAFPLDEETVTRTLREAGLPGVISESETSSRSKDHTHYVIRSETECYENAENKRFIADISSANYHGERALATIFAQEVPSNQMVWEDWKQQILFAARLYGGFENEEDVYQAFLGKELPEGKTSFAWDVQLSQGYCRVSYHNDNLPSGKQFPYIRVNIYESYELYQKLKLPVT